MNRIRPSAANCAAVVTTVAMLASGCSAVVSSTTSQLSHSLANALVNQNDPETVRQGAPAYLVLLDGLIADEPNNPDVLLAGAQLYSSYASAFVQDQARAERLALKGRNYGWEGLCALRHRTCGTWTRPYEEFESTIESLGPKEVSALFTAAGAWATWIQVNKDDWSAIADKARVDAMIRRVVEIDPTYQRGAPYVYLGVLDTLLPEAMGGKPEQGRADFERAIELSSGRNLMAKVLFAKQYARLTFDRELHDRLCKEVIDADPIEEGLTLANTLAQEEAAQLLEGSEEYFGE